MMKHTLKLSQETQNILFTRSWRGGSSKVLQVGVDQDTITRVSNIVGPYRKRLCAVIFSTVGVEIKININLWGMNKSVRTLDSGSIIKTLNN